MDLIEQVCISSTSKSLHAPFHIEGVEKEKITIGNENKEEHPETHPGEAYPLYNTMDDDNKQVEPAL